MNILIVAGGTGGHLFPAIRLADEIRSQYVGEVLFITSFRKQDRDILKGENIPFKILPVIGIKSRGVFHILNFSIRLIAGAVKSLFVLLYFRPSVVIGFGGYVSGPVLLCAALLKIKTVIHEQNVYPGKTNKILANFVDRVAVTFPETLEYLKRFQPKIIVSGNLLRKGLRKGLRTGDIFTVLAMGGSQGAMVLNKIIPQAVGLLQGNKKDMLEMIHISGYRDRDDVIKAYKNEDIKSRVFPFTKEMDKFYNECDFVIARAGATTVSELLYLAKPSILVPYPHANGHQRLNAKVLSDIGLAILLEENDLSAEGLRDVIERLMDTEVLINMSEKAKNDNRKDACGILMKEMISLTGNR